MRKRLTLASKIVANIFIYLFVIVMVAGSIAMANASIINTSLKIPTYELVDKDPDPDEDTEYYKSDFTSVRETKNHTEKMTQEIVKEGSVLLKNENGALPLSSWDSVSLYSISSVQLVYAGTGSSGTNTSGTVDLKTALEDPDRAGLKVNSELWNWYSANTDTYGRGSAGGTVGQSFSIKEAPWGAINGGRDNRADAAIFVLARNGGEGADLTLSGGSSSDMTDGNYLKLSTQESEVLEGLNGLKKQGTIGKIIVLLNSANQVESKFIDDGKYGIDAALWIGDIGSTGIYGVAELLVGKANPSGRLADTFWKEHYLNPALTNFGDFKYNGSIFSGDSRSNSYVVYQEGIYVGYRYTETRYEDLVMGTGNAGDFDYEKVVSYPFGYGLSYSEFSYSDFKVTPPLLGSKTRTYTVSVKVTNTGSVAGKEVVQIYLQKPYTQYDIDNHIEKSAVELVGFAKTEVIAPDKSETVQIEVKEEYFASYDAYEAKTYIVDEGEYYLTAAKDAHDAINNILTAKSYSVTDGMTANGDASLTYKTSMAFDKQTYSVSAVTDAEITNQFDNADLNIYDGAGDNSVTYISRNDWAGTVKLGYTATNQKLNNQVIVKGTSQMKDDVLAPKIEQDFSVEYPTYSAEPKYTLLSMRGLAYDAPEWEYLLDQLTWAETATLLSDGLRLTGGIPSIMKPKTIDHNGATGPTEPYNSGSIDKDGKITDGADNNGLAVRMQDPDRAEKPTVYPCNGLVASTYNKQLAGEYGKAIGNDCLWAGYAGLYGFGINTHRTMYGGRTFEYYSEDPILAGQVCAYQTMGVQAYGCNVYLKHCFLNDQERNREGVSTWANEQTIRDVYLRPFQIAIEDGGAMNVMTGFNRLGVVWTGHQGFINTVLHGEFDMKGLAVSDWFQTYYMTIPGGVLYGNDLPDGTQNTKDRPYRPFEGYEEDKGYGELAWAMRESAHRILYHTVNSNAMNTISATTEMIMLPIAWQTALKAVEIVVGILFGLSMAFFIGMTVLNAVRPEKVKNEE